MAADKRVLVVGCGEAGLLVAAVAADTGCQVTVLSDHYSEEVRAGSVRSTQVKFAQAVQLEEQLGLRELFPGVPPINGLSFQQVIEGCTELKWAAPTSAPAISVNQVDRLADWMDELSRRGVWFVVDRNISVATVDRYARHADVVIVTQSLGDLARLFPLDPGYPVVSHAARRLAAVYFDGVEPIPGNPVQMTSLVGLGEILLIPAYTGSPRRGDGRTCHIVLVEALPSAALDCFAPIADPRARADQILGLLRRFLPEVYSRCRRASLIHDRGTLTGAVRAAVRQPIGQLPCGQRVLAGGDLVSITDPLGAQGANAASRFAWMFGQAMTSGDSLVDERWMHRFMARYLRDVAYPARQFTTMLLYPPPEVREMLAAAATSPSVARRLVAMFEDPAVLRARGDRRSQTTAAVVAAP